jgi:hypothetical protein
MNHSLCIEKVFLLGRHSSEHFVTVMATLSVDLLISHVLKKWQEKT